MPSREPSRIHLARGLFGCLALAGMGEDARAGAWTLAEGSGEVIATGLSSTAEETFGSGGREPAPAAFTKGSASLFVQHGWTDRLTVFAKVEAGREADDMSGYARSGLSEFTAGARYQFHASGGFVASAGLSGRVAAEGEEGIERGATRIEPRLAAGYGFELFGLPAFAEAEAGYGWRIAGEGFDEAKLDLAVGLRPWERWLVLAQAFSTIAVAGPDGADGYAHHKLQGSVVYDIAEHWSLQAGIFATVAGKNAPQERGVVSAIWYRY
ncbi:hypothetical protein [Jiella avicenniae]|uniref:Uncharacterized protein n=1 Tax=Jiella avicenniae TaxID=2907202 RepID=A0A9X1TAP9_9HYPH|nr:hypothetical protein [Jiella avicenniae]MCE7027373.1 hypothetical protein [Jiella avicenniae]